MLSPCVQSVHLLCGLYNTFAFVQNLMNVHLSKLQQDLFHELKKVACAYWNLIENYSLFFFFLQNGTTRSLCAALDCFSSLFPLTRPAKCSSYAQALLPILVRLTNRQEEALHEALQDAMSKILPTVTPFVTTANMQARLIFLRKWQLWLSTGVIKLSLLVAY